MKIGLTTACYKPTLNGVTRMIDLSRKHLIARGYEVTIFTFGKPQKGDSAENVVRSPGVPIGKTGYYLAPGYSKAAQQKLATMDIVHAHHLSSSLEMAHRYAAAPVLYTNHTRYDLYTKAHTGWPQAWADRIMQVWWPRNCAFADVVVAPSSAVQKLLKRFGVKTPIEVIQNGVSLSRYLQGDGAALAKQLTIHPDQFVFAYVGRLAKEKNILQLVNSFRVAKEVMQNAKLILVGDGPDRHRIEQRIRELGLDSAIHLTGEVKSSRVPDFLALADCFVTASLSEVHPLTIIEAMAAGCPIVAYEADGIRGTVENNQTGFLADPAQPKTLGHLMVKMIEQGALRARFGRNAQIVSQQFHIDHHIDQLLHLYHTLLEERPDLQRKQPHGGVSIPHLNRRVNPTILR